MKDKIFAALKQEYSQLGLGDEILMAHADSLAGIGLVTEQNLSSVVKGQKAFLEGLQKANDKRAAEAANTAREKAKKEFEEETAKKEAEAKAKAEEEAKKKAEEEAKAKAEKEKAEAEAAKKKAEEEAERKRLEELKKNEIPEWYIKQQEQAAEKAKAEREAAEAEAKAAAEKAEKEHNELMEVLKGLRTQNETMSKALDDYKAQAEQKEKELAAKERETYILNKAREMGIPQTRIDEGFVIAPDADNAAIDTYLGKVATNIKSSTLPGKNHQQMAEVSEVSKEEVDKIVAGMIK